MRVWAIVTCASVVVSCGTSHDDEPTTSASNARCSSFVVLPAMIDVTDATTNAAICDADLTATGPNSPFVLSKNPNDLNACEYNGPAVTGSYTITVSKSGFQTATVLDVNATIQSCDGPKEMAQIVQVKLIPD